MRFPATEFTGFLSFHLSNLCNLWFPMALRNGDYRFLVAV